MSSFLVNLARRAAGIVEPTALMPSRTAILAESGFAAGVPPAPTPLPESPAPAGSQTIVRRKEGPAPVPATRGMSGLAAPGPQSVPPIGPVAPAIPRSEPQGGTDWNARQAPESAVASADSREGLRPEPAAFAANSVPTGDDTRTVATGPMPAIEPAASLPQPAALEPDPAPQPGITERVIVVTSGVTELAESPRHAATPVTASTRSTPAAEPDGTVPPRQPALLTPERTPIRHDAPPEIPEPARTATIVPATAARPNQISLPATPAPAGVQPPAPEIQGRRPVEIKIGTIEVRVSAPPAPLPTPSVPDGFDDYALARNYIFGAEP